MNVSPTQDKRIELKYLLDEPLAQAVKQWAREHLGVDSHCCETLVDSYDVNTLYLDTLELDLYHRTGVVGSTKHRIRRYSFEETLWLECKRKKKDVVRKNRTAVPANEVLDRLASEPSLASTDWCGSILGVRNWIDDGRLGHSVQHFLDSIEYHEVHGSRFIAWTTRSSLSS